MSPASGDGGADSGAVPASGHAPASTPDQVAAWLSWTLLLVGTLSVSALSLILGFLRFYVCLISPCSGEPRGGDALVLTVGYLGLLGGLVLGSLTMLLVRTRRRRRSWPWPVGALVVAVLASVGWWLGLGLLYPGLRGS